MKVEEVQEAFNRLRSEEKHQFVFQLLMNGDLDYTELSNLYVTWLEMERDANKDKLVDSTTWLAMTWSSLKRKTDRRSAARAIVNSGVIKGSPTHQKCVAFLQEKT